MVSTMELHSLAPDPRAGAGAAARLDLSQGDQGLDLQALGEAGAAVAPWSAMRQRLPGLAAEKLPKFGVEAMWVYHPLISPRLARICKLAGVELIAWTVDDQARMRKLVEPGVDGLCSNDPRLFADSSAACSRQVWLDRRLDRNRGCSDRAGRRVALAAAFCCFTADSSSSAVKPPTAWPSSA